MFLRLLCLFCYLSCFLLPSINSSAKELNMLNIRTIDVSPYGIMEDGQYNGIYYELSNMLFDNGNTKFENIIYPYARIQHELKSGHADVTIMFKYQELAPYVKYITPLPALRNVVIGRNSTPISSIDDLNGKVIAYLRGAKFSDEIDKAQNISKQFVNDFQQGIDMMRLNRVDVIIGPLSAILYSAKKAGLSRDFFGEPYTVSSKTPWLQVSKRSVTKLDLAEIEKRLKKLIKEGNFAQLNEKYLN